VLTEILWDLLAVAFGPGDLHPDGPPRSSARLRKRHRWNVVLRQLGAAGPTDRAAGLTRRWHRFVLEVVPGRPYVRYRRRSHWVWHTVPAPAVHRGDVRLPGRHETSKFRQIFPVRWGAAGCEVGIWAVEVRALKASLDAAASGNPLGR